MLCLEELLLLHPTRDKAFLENFTRKVRIYIRTSFGGGRGEEDPHRLLFKIPFSVWQERELCGTEQHGDMVLLTKNALGSAVKVGTTHTHTHARRFSFTPIKEGLCSFDHAKSHHSELEKNQAIA